MTRIHVCDDSQLWLPVPPTKQQAASLKLSTLPILMLLSKDNNCVCLCAFRSLHTVRIFCVSVISLHVLILSMKDILKM